ncbi:sulfotransferase [Alteromonas sp. C1M14]|uniref:sulfotransferase family protein n=1 Tax=Alteromonas sp. C1M14 TaxID=2841567 RepID=UPI001C09A23A|nr:sulfotransferase [Alteromonas sp. C1M14]MBU2979208.1 sulfotransferase [Alteromonas sp. C1M14]
MNNQPVIVGGVGGSGTRIISEASILMGFDMGHTLNHASDNLLFTLLFKRRDWLLKHIDDPEKIAPVISTFAHLSGTDVSLTMNDLRVLGVILFDWMRREETVDGLGRRFAYKNFLKVVNNRRRKQGEQARWGLKEPNSWLLLSHFLAAYPELKYIHTIRNGIDMSLSENQQQCINWSEYVLDEKVSVQTCTPRVSLKYWVQANQQVLELGRQLPSHQFLVIKFEDLCASPAETMARVIAFLNVDVCAETRAKVLRLPHATKCKRKYTKDDLVNYDAEDLTALPGLGYSI